MTKKKKNLTGLRDAQISGETFLGISERVFLEEISLWIGKLRKEDCPPNMSGNHPIPWEPEENRETGGRQIHSLCLSWEIYPLLPWTSVITQAPWFSVGFPTQIMAYTISIPLPPPLFPRLWTQTELQHADFPGLPACRCQIVGLLRNRNRVSEDLKCGWWAAADFYLLPQSWHHCLHYFLTVYNRPVISYELPKLYCECSKVHNRIIIYGQSVL